MATKRRCDLLLKVITHCYANMVVQWVIETKESVVGNKKYKYITVNEREIGTAGGTGMWPPPPVSVSVNQRIRIKVTNRMSDDEAVTLHFHGILQKDGYVTMDGPQGITQRYSIPSQTLSQRG